VENLDYLERLKKLVRAEKRKFELENFNKEIIDKTIKNNINSKDINEIILKEKNNNIYLKKEKYTEKYEVLTDGSSYWITVETAEKIIDNLTFEQANELKEYMEVLTNEILISRKFIDFVLDNTFNPQFIPQFVFVKTRVRTKDFDDDDKDMGLPLVELLIDNREIEQEQEIEQEIDFGGKIY